MYTKKGPCDKKVEFSANESVAAIELLYKYSFGIDLIKKFSYVRLLDRLRILFQRLISIRILQIDKNNV